MSLATRKVKHIFVVYQLNFLLCHMFSLLPVICWGPDGFLVNFPDNNYLSVISPEYTFPSLVAFSLLFLLI